MELQKKLQKVKELAEGSKVRRLLSAPFKYIFGMIFFKAIYPLTKKGMMVEGCTFFGQTLELLLPAGMDIYLTGGKTHDSEVRLALFLINRLKSGDQFLDVGAHLGYFSSLAAHLVGQEGKVVAFEASPNTFIYLNKNLQQLPQSQCFNIAVAAQSGTLSFYEFPILYSEYNTLELKQFEGQAWFLKNPPRQVNVPSVALDDFIAQHQLQPRIVKIDVEGAEDQVLQGMQSFLNSHSDCAIVMEYLGAQRHNSAHQDAINLLEKLGYQSFIIDQNGHLEPIVDLNGYFQEKQLESDNVVFQKNG